MNDQFPTKSTSLPIRTKAIQFLNEDFARTHENSFTAFKNERSSMGKLITSDYIFKENEIFHDIQERKAFAAQLYVPPTYKIDVPLVRQKVSLSVQPSEFNKLIKKNVIHIFERGGIKKSAAVGSMDGNDQFNKNATKINMRVEDFVYDLNQTQANISKNIIVSPENQKFVKRGHRDLSIMKTQPFSQAEEYGSQLISPKQSVFDDGRDESPKSQTKSVRKIKKNLRAKALIKKCLLEEKAVEIILNRKGLKKSEDTGNQHKLNHLQSIPVEDGSTQQIDFPNLDEVLGYDYVPKQSSVHQIDSDEYMLKFFNLNLNVQQRSEHAHNIERASKVKLPHLHLTNRNFKTINSPPIGFYSPNHDYILKKNYREIVFPKTVGKKMSCGELANSIVKNSHRNNFYRRNDKSKL